MTKESRPWPRAAFLFPGPPVLFPKERKMSDETDIIEPFAAATLPHWVTGRFPTRHELVRARP
jgi:hypothetical protein